MTDLAITDEPLHKRTGKPLKVAPQISKLLDRMVETGERYPDACKAVGMNARSARKALDQQHVLNELRRRKHVFRAAISAGNIVRLAELRDQDEHKIAALGAIKLLEQIEDNEQQQPKRTTPGITIVIGSPTPMPMVTVGQNVGSNDDIADT